MKKYFRIIFRATFRWTLDGLFLLFRLVLYLVGQLVLLPVYIVRGAGRPTTTGYLVGVSPEAAATAYS